MMTGISDLPYEILSNILDEAAKLNEADGASFTFGLSQPPMPYAKPPLQRYVRGMIPPDKLKWDTASSIRQVCSVWHEWALHYSLKQLYLRRWRGSEKWLELPKSRAQYQVYEMNVPRGAFAYQDPFKNLTRTAKFLADCPHAAVHVRRLWFDGFYTAETDALISSILRSCTNLRMVTLPWTVMRRLSPRDWEQLLGTKQAKPLYSLELQAIDIPEIQEQDAANQVDLKPLRFVDFSTLRRLKFIGDTSFMPVTDEDLRAIARTATNLEEFHITSLSSITINGVMAIIKAAQKTLRVIEHAPRSDDGFWHPHPGHSVEQEHICSILSHCPKLEDLSISVPSMCSELFANKNVRWKGDCQVRALQLCEHQRQPRSSTTTTSIPGKPNNPPMTPHDQLRALLHTARTLTTARATSISPETLRLELFHSDFIFEPQLQAVHGVFEYAALASGGAWPPERRDSGKGPYGSTGLYGKEEEESVFECVGEGEFLRGAGAGWVRVSG
ncbi:hypothetical protein K402DRAFT_90747 [Aulographum hederae CBS 113979]|uniref:F-box domain-containing protein n=1 Tax=Aulographum hederae CBS 113979 TaxID=1176131 RepID=A0A6G1GYV1_9PEZI|nr:hypothetical protein K402DRAFT_90747 [Aulographum hederae CBS 113979]